MIEPHIIGHVKLSERREVRIETCTVRGVPSLGLRYLFETADGDWLPLAKGFSVPAAKVRELYKLIGRAIKQQML